MHIGQLTPSGFRLDPRTGLDAAAQEFSTLHHVRFERFVAPALLARWLAWLDAAPFARRVTGNWIGPPPIDLFLDARDIDCAIEFAMNDVSLFRTIQSVAGCGHLFQVRVL